MVKVAKRVNLIGLITGVLLVIFSVNVMAGEVPIPKEWQEALEASRLLNTVRYFVSGKAAKDEPFWGKMNIEMISEVPTMARLGLLGDFDPFWITWYVQRGQVTRDTWFAVQKYAIMMWSFGYITKDECRELQSMYELPAGMPQWQRIETMAEMCLWTMSTVSLLMDGRTVTGK